jgi:hypothetical protein
MNCHVTAIRMRGDTRAGLGTAGRTLCRTASHLCHRSRSVRSAAVAGTSLPTRFVRKAAFQVSRGPRKRNAFLRHNSDAWPHGDRELRQRYDDRQRCSQRFVVTSGASHPVTPSTTRSSTAPTRVESTGVPHAVASPITVGNPSRQDANTKHSALA